MATEERLFSSSTQVLTFWTSLIGCLLPATSQREQTIEETPTSLLLTSMCNKGGHTIDKKYRGDVLMQLHVGHPGITRIKGLSRMYVRMPGVSNGVEESVQDCIPCKKNQSKPPVTPLHPWAWPTRPWARLHIDYAGPIQGQMFLIIIDAHSKWIEAIPTSGSTFRVVIKELQVLFSKFGLPECVVSDNGTCFTSAQFK